MGNSEGNGHSNTHRINEEIQCDFYHLSMSKVRGKKLFYRKIMHKDISGNTSPLGWPKKSQKSKTFCFHVWGKMNFCFCFGSAFYAPPPRYIVRHVFQINIIFSFAYYSIRGDIAKLWTTSRRSSSLRRRGKSLSASANNLIEIKRHIV